MKQTPTTLSPRAAVHAERIRADLAQQRAWLDSERERIQKLDAALLDRERTIDEQAVNAAEEEDTHALHVRNCDLAERLKVAMVRVTAEGFAPNPDDVTAALAYFDASDDALQMATACGTLDRVQRAAVYLHTQRTAEVEAEQLRAEREKAMEALQAEWLANRTQENALEGRV